MASPAMSQGACSRCRAKKIKCDGESPKCGPCTKAGSDCLISSGVGNGQYDRRYVDSLQRRVQELQLRQSQLQLDLAQAATPTTSSPRATYAVSSRNHCASDSPAETVRPPPHTTTAHNVRVYDHGMGFIDTLFAKVKSSANSYLTERQVPLRDSVPETLPATSTATSSTHITPELVTTLFDAYIRRAHSRYPFMDLHTILQLRDDMTSSVIGGATMSNQDLFRSYLILATGATYHNQELSVIPAPQSHTVQFLDPISFFSLARERANQTNLLHGMEGVQNLSLVARFGLFFSIGVSLWDVSFLCLRTCIESGLQRRPETRLPAFEEQMRRRVFWQAYGLDRYFSETLGRPFGIPDTAITTGITAEVDDETLKEAASRFPDASLDELMQSKIPTNHRSSMTVAVYHLKLRRITSHMHRDLRRLRHRSKANSPYNGSTTSSSDMMMENITASGKVWSTYGNYMEQLCAWQRDCKKTLGPDEIETPGSNSDVYVQDERWIDLHFHQDKLSLIRLCIEPDSDVRLRNGLIDPLDLVDELYEAASETIRLYSNLINDAKIEPTTGRLYRVLAAGLSVLYTIKLESQRDEKAGVGGSNNNNNNNESSVRTNQQPVTTDNGGSAPSRQWLSSREAILSLCTNNLDRMSRQMAVKQKSTPKYVAYFELLCREVLRGINTMAGDVESRQQGKKSKPRNVSERPSSENSDGGEAGELGDHVEVDDDSEGEGETTKSKRKATATLALPCSDGGHAASSSFSTAIHPTYNQGDVVDDNTDTASFTCFPEQQQQQQGMGGLFQDQITTPWGLGDSEYTTAQLTCQQPTAHLQPCYCGLVVEETDCSNDLLFSMTDDWGWCQDGFLHDA